MLELPMSLQAVPGAHLNRIHEPLSHFWKSLPAHWKAPVLHCALTVPPVPPPPEPPDPPDPAKSHIMTADEIPLHAVPGGHLKSIHVLRSHFWKSALLQRNAPSEHPVAGLGAGPGAGLGTVGGGVAGGLGVPDVFDGDPPIGDGPDFGEGVVPCALTVIVPVIPF